MSKKKRFISVIGGNSAAYWQRSVVFNSPAAGKRGRNFDGTWRFTPPTSNVGL